MSISFTNKILKMSVDFERYSDNARVPLGQTSGAAGYDLYSDEEKIFKSFGRKLIRLDICMTTPDGYHSRIVAHSGLALKK